MHPVPSRGNLSSCSVFAQKRDSPRRRVFAVGSNSPCASPAGSAAVSLQSPPHTQGLSGEPQCPGGWGAAGSLLSEEEQATVRCWAALIKMFDLIKNCRTDVK